MARVIAKIHTTTTTDWEVVYATESGLPKGTEAIINGIVCNNPTGGSVDMDFAIIETPTATPTDSDRFVSQIAVATTVIATILPTSDLTSITLSGGQTLVARSSDLGVIVRVFGSQATEEYLVGLAVSA
jgi:hypothetical protein